jgi:hypothetical protein
MRPGLSLKVPTFGVNDIYMLKILEDGRLINIPTYEELRDSIQEMMYGKPEGYIVSFVKCHICDHKWVAVWPETAEQIECPHCGSDTDPLS